MIRVTERVFIFAIMLFVVCGMAQAQAKDADWSASVPLADFGNADPSLQARTLALQSTLPSDPLFKVQGLDGKIHDLADLRGSVVLISFGATWCAPCSTELRALEELLTEYREKPVKFYWVSIERPEEATNAALKRYAKERKVTIPVMRDTGKMVFLQFTPRVRLPMIVLLGKDGKVDAPVQFGMRAPADAYKADMRMRLNKLLAERADGEQ